MEKREDYRNVQDPKERRKIQNRVNQRNYRLQRRKTEKRQPTEQASEQNFARADAADSVTVAPMAHDDDPRPPKRPCHERLAVDVPPLPAPPGQTYFLDAEQTREAYRELPFGSFDHTSAPGGLTNVTTGGYEQGGTAPAVSAVPAPVGNPLHITTRAGDGLSTTSFPHSATWAEPGEYAFHAGASAGPLDMHPVGPWPTLSTVPSYDANQLAADPEDLSYWLKEFDSVGLEQDAEASMPEGMATSQARTHSAPSDVGSAENPKPASEAALRQCFERARIELGTEPRDFRRVLRHLN